MLMIEEFYQVSRIAIPLCYKKLHLFNIIKVTCCQKNNDKNKLLINKQLISNQTKNLSLSKEANKKSNFFCKNTNLIKKNELFYKPSTIELESFSNKPGFVFYQDNCDNTAFKTDKNIFINLPVR
jgi:hypothetical protein